MSYIAAVSGSPSVQSRTGHLLATAERTLQAQGLRTRRIDVRALHSAALVAADATDPSVELATEIVRHACAVVVATPIYNAAYSGLLKTFLDLLPRDAFAGKPIVSIATGGSAAHMLALDYTLKPVLSAMGARHHLANIFASDDDVPKIDGEYHSKPHIASRINEAATALVDALSRRAMSSNDEPVLALNL